MFTPLLASLLLSASPSLPVVPPANALLDLTLDDGSKVTLPAATVSVATGCSMVVHSDATQELEVNACRHGGPEEPPEFTFSVERKLRDGSTTVHQRLKANARLLPGGSVLLGQWPSPASGQHPLGVVVTWRVPRP